MYSYYFANFAVFFTVLGTLTAAPPEDLITYLPNLDPQPTFNQYAGYLNATNGRHFFYWFTEAQNVDPVTAPLVFWFNGGPGCSSINGMLTENGPFRISSDGQTVIYNEFAWNMLANIVFLESPANVGFAYADDDAQLLTSDDQTAIDNYAAVTNFFEKFPEYLPNQMFITGESYAGIYIPTLSYLILNGTNNFNFKGIAIGNAFQDSKSDYNTQMMYEAFHGLYDLVVLNNLLKYCCDSTSITECDFYDSTDANCINAQITANDAVSASGVNPYYIIGDCARSLDPSAKYYQPFDPRFRPLPKAFTLEQRQKVQNLGHDLPCFNSGNIRTWINQESVRTALHVPDFVQQWDACSDYVRDTYNETYDTVFPLYPFLLSHLRILLYNGDADTVCNFLGGEYFSEHLGLNELEPYHPWFFEGQTAGFKKAFNNLTFLTILGSGHMVPTDKPAQAQHMFNNFIYNIPFTVTKK